MATLARIGASADMMMGFCKYFTHTTHLAQRSRIAHRANAFEAANLVDTFAAIAARRAGTLVNVRFAVATCKIQINTDTNMD